MIENDSQNASKNHPKRDGTTHRKINEKVTEQMTEKNLSKQRTGSAFKSLKDSKRHYHITQHRIRQDDETSRLHAPSRSARSLRSRAALV